MTEISMNDPDDTLHRKWQYIGSIGQYTNKLIPDENPNMPREDRAVMVYIHDPKAKPEDCVRCAVYSRMAGFMFPEIGIADTMIMVYDDVLAWTYAAHPPHTKPPTFWQRLKWAFKPSENI